MENKGLWGTIEGCLTSSLESYDLTLFEFCQAEVLQDPYFIVITLYELQLQCFIITVVFTSGVAELTEKWGGGKQINSIFSMVWVKSMGPKHAYW